MKLTIITINYNDKAGLLSTMKSVAAQTSHNYEYVVIDGGSSDGSVEVIRNYEDIVDFWTSEKDSGIYNAMNKAVCHATGDYCLFLNSGDKFYRDDVLERVIPLLASGEDYITGRELMIRNSKPFVLHMPPRHVSSSFFIKTSLRHQASFIRRSVLLDNCYDESLRLVSDWKHSVETLVTNHGTYKPIKIIVDICERDGRTLHQEEIGKKEKRKVLKELFPEHDFKQTLMMRLVKKLSHYRDVINARLIWMFDC